MFKSIQIEQAIAPYIIGNTAVKKLLFLQLFSNPLYDEIVNVLLIGDVASSKTQLIKELTQLHERSFFLTRNSTEVGLIGRATEFGLVGGVIKEIQGGILGVDELDKCNDKLKNIMLQVMDKYEITVAKFGWNAKLPAKLNVVATANPIAGNWISGQPNIDEVPFKKAMCNRFHVIVPFTALKTEEYDKLVDSFVTRENKAQETERKAVVREYVAKAEGITSIDISNDIIEKVVKYVKRIKSKYEAYLPIISPRQIEGILYLMKASARMETRDFVNEKDFNDVTGLYDEIVNLWLPKDD